MSDQASDASSATTSLVRIRVRRSQKARWVKAARACTRPNGDAGKLDDWICEVLDRAAFSEGEAPTSLRACPGWALYRPDGTLMHFFGGADMSPEREENILSHAWEELRPKGYHAAGTPMPLASDQAKEKGYRVVAVTISPSA